MTDRLSSTPLRILGTRDGFLELAAVNTTILKNGACVYVTSVRDFFVLLRDSTATADGSEIVAPVNGPGRWFRWNIGTSFWEQQAEWYVDEQNVTGAASDSNIGDSATAPLASYAELTRRIREANIQQDTTVHLLSDCNDDSVFQFFGRIAAPAVLTVIGEATTELLANTTLTTVQNIVVGTTRPSIQAGALDWTTAGPGGTSLVGKRCRVVASGGSQLDALFWIEAVDSGDPTIAYISRPYESVTPPAFGVNRSLSNGDVIVVEELTNAGLLDLQFQGNGVVPFTNGTTSVLLQDLRGPGTNNTIAVFGALSFAQGVTAYGCDLSWLRVVCSFGNIMACQVGSVVGSSNYWVLQNDTFFSACSGSSKFDTLNVVGPGTLSLFNSCSFNKTLNLSNELGFARLLTDSSGVSFWEWSPNDAALEVRNACFASIGGALWGVATGLNTLGINVHTGGHLQYPSGTVPTVTGSAADDFEVGGVGDVYANLPGAGQNPGNNNAWLVVSA